MSSSKGLDSEALALLDVLPVPVWIIDAETLVFLAVNKCATDSYGYSVDEFLSMTVLDIRSRSEAERVIEFIETTREDQGGSTLEGPRRLQALSGREASSRSDAEGRPERHGERRKVAARHRSSSCEVTKFARGYENRKAPSREPFVFAWRFKTEGTGRTPCGPTRL